MVFSIIIPVYRVEKYIHKCMDSVLNQSFSDLEIILVDDGSPDGCPAICDSYAARDPRVRVIHKPNGGLSDARNAGIGAAKGDYILLLDSDDYIDPDTCLRLLPFARSGCDIIVGDGVCQGGNAQLRHDYDCPECSGRDFLMAALDHGRMPMAAWLYVFRRHFLEEKGLSFKKGILHEDEQFTPRAFLAAERVANSRVCFYHYVIRDGSITTKPDLRKNARDLLDTCRELEQIYARLPEDALRIRLTDLLAEKYLSLFQQGRLYRWGRAYCPRGYLLSLARLPKTRVKTLLFAMSPRLYWHINHASKRLR